MYPLSHATAWAANIHFFCRDFCAGTLSAHHPCHSPLLLSEHLLIIQVPLQWDSSHDEDAFAMPGGYTMSGVGKHCIITCMKVIKLMITFKICAKFFRKQCITYISIFFVQPNSFLCYSSIRYWAIIHFPLRARGNQRLGM